MIDCTITADSRLDPDIAQESGRDHKTRLSYWFPRIEAAGLPVPRTLLVPISAEEEEGLWPMHDAEPSPTIAAISERIGQAVDRIGGCPVFLRTDFTSGKHDWRHSCYLADRSRIGWHVFALHEASILADAIGLPCDLFAVRELLSTKALFTAFHGRMPITREFRFFVRDGAVEHVQPYWPFSVFKDQKIHRADWRLLLLEGSRLSDEERLILTDLALRVNAAVPGCWSVDFLETTDRGWVLTDMAEGEKSYRWGTGI